MIGDYPAAGDREVALREAGNAESDWLIVPEVTHITFQETSVMLDLLMTREKLKQKLAFIYYDAIPLRAKDL